MTERTIYVLELTSVNKKPAGIPANRKDRNENQKQNQENQP